MQIGQKFFKQYGQHFVVRSGRNRMKTFAAVVKDSRGKGTMYCTHGFVCAACTHVLVGMDVCIADIYMDM